MMKNVFIIGGGASGLVAAIYSARKGNRVTILERNSSCGKKLLMTGNGHCNYGNEDQSLTHYHSSRSDLLSTIISSKSLEEITSLFSKIGIIPKIKNGYYYPFSNQATSIKEALLNEAIHQGVHMITDTFVTKIVKNDSGFTIETEGPTYQADQVIISTGSKAFPKTGSDGNGYELAKSFGHQIIEVLPSLVQCCGEEKYFKDWKGIRAEVIVSLYEENKKIQEQAGEILLTDYGVSGICILNLSEYISKGLNKGISEQIRINFIPWFEEVSKDKVIDFLTDRERLMSKRTVEQLLEGFLPYKLIHVMLKKCHISRESTWSMLSTKEKDLLVTHLMAFPVDITSTKSFDAAQVCSGGVCLSEINLETMESKKVSGLYFTGEIIDVDGDCGGYNLTFAWISGMLAGKASGK